MLGDCCPVHLIFHLFLFQSGNQQGSLLIDEIQEQENILEQCVSQLENAEASRGALVSQLKEAIREQVCFHHSCEFSNQQSQSVEKYFTTVYQTYVSGIEDGTSSDAVARKNYHLHSFLFSFHVAK